MWIRLTPDGEGELTASEPALLYALVHWLTDGLTDEQTAALPDGLLLKETTRQWMNIKMKKVTSCSLNPAMYCSVAAERFKDILETRRC